MESRASAGVCALYGGYRGQVLRRARQLLGHEQEAEDATQEVFLRLIDADERLLLHPEPMAWLLRVTTNLCLNRLRDQKRRKNLLAQKPAGNDQHGQDAEVRTAVIEILAGVPDDLQQIAVHYHADGMTCDEIAPLFGVSRRTIGNRLIAFQRLASERIAGPSAVARSSASAGYRYSPVPRATRPPSGPVREQSYLVYGVATTHLAPG